MRRVHLLGTSRNACMCVFQCSVERECRVSQKSLIVEGQCCMMKNNGISVVLLDQTDAFISWESVCVLWIATCVGSGHDRDKIKAEFGSLE